MYSECWVFLFFSFFCFELTGLIAQLHCILLSLRYSEHFYFHVWFPPFMALFSPSHFFLCLLLSFFFFFLSGKAVHSWLNCIAIWTPMLEKGTHLNCLKWRHLCISSLYVGQICQNTSGVFCPEEQRLCCQFSENQMGEDHRGEGISIQHAHIHVTHILVPSLPLLVAPNPTIFSNYLQKNHPPCIKTWAVVLLWDEGEQQLGWEGQAWAVDIWWLLNRFALSTLCSRCCCFHSIYCPESLCLEHLGCESGLLGSPCCVSKDFNKPFTVHQFLFLRGLVCCLLIQSSFLLDLCLKMISFLLGLPRKHYYTFLHPVLLCSISDSVPSWECCWQMETVSGHLGSWLQSSEHQWRAIPGPGPGPLLNPPLPWPWHRCTRVDSLPTDLLPGRPTQSS